MANQINKIKDYTTVYITATSNPDVLKNYSILLPALQLLKGLLLKKLIFQKLVL
jgi:hypothetical protein